MKKNNYNRNKTDFATFNRKKLNRFTFSITTKTGRIVKSKVVHRFKEKRTLRGVPFIITAMEYLKEIDYYRGKLIAKISEPLWNLFEKSKGAAPKN